VRLKAEISQLKRSQELKSGEKKKLKIKMDMLRSIGKQGGSVAEWLACWTQAQMGPGSNRSRGDVG